jgi:hypothetical protein
VSNDAVGRFRSLRKVLIALGLSLCAVLFLTLLASQIEHRLFRRRAEILLSKVQALELRKTSWQDAQVQLQQWGPNRVIDDSGDPHMCSPQVTLDEFVFARFRQRNPFVKLDDYSCLGGKRWRGPEPACRKAISPIPRFRTFNRGVDYFSTHLSHRVGQRNQPKALARGIDQDYGALDESE